MSFWLAEPHALIRRSRPPGGLEPPEPKVRRLAGGSPPTPIYDPCRLARKGKQIPFSSRALASGWASQPGAWGIPTTGSHGARAQSAVADGARARNRTLRGPWHRCDLRYGPQPPFPNSRIMLLISVILSITKFPPEQRVEQDGMIQSHDRSSTSTSTKNSQNKTMHRSGRPAALNFRNHFGGHSVIAVVLAYATTGSFRARAQSAVADGARNRNRTPRVHGINATCVTAPKTCRSTTRRSCSLSPLSYPFTKFLPEQRVDRDGMIQSHDRSSTSTSTKKNPEQAAAPKCAVFFRRDEISWPTGIVFVTHRNSST